MGKNIKPGKWIYGLGIFIIAAGIISFVILLITNIGGLISSFQQVNIPGKGDIILNEAGKYTIFYERQGIFEDKGYDVSQKNIFGLKCNIVDKETSENIKVSPVSASSKYSIGARHGVSVFEFTITKPGTYEVSSGYENGFNRPESVLTIGKGFINKILTLVFGGIAIMFVTFPAGIIIIILTYIKRRKFIRRSEEISNI